MQRCSEFLDIQAAIQPAAVDAESTLGSEDTIKMQKKCMKEERMNTKP